MFVTVSTAVLAASDVRQTVAWYHDVLGFSEPWLWGEPPGFGGIGWGAGQLMFIGHPDLAARVEGHQHYFDVEDVDALFERHRKAGADIFLPLADMLWGKREYTIRDPNGYHLRFGGSSTPLERESRPAPEDLTMERRLPSSEEFLRLREAVGWGTLPMSDVEEILAKSLFGIVAVKGGVVVGMALAVGDGRQQIYIQDVSVLPSMQGTGVGTLLLKDLITYARELVPPGCWLSLFCVPTLAAFYGRHGFRKGHGMTLQL